MIERINNFDTSYFKIRVGGIQANSAAEKYVTDKVISFEITEELSKFMSGNIQLEEDFYFKTSASMKRFEDIEVWWGYKNKNQIQKDAYVKSQNPGELFTAGQLTRYAKGKIQNPSWVSGSDGKMIYNCSFYCFDNLWLGRDSKLYNKTTKGKVVLDVLTEMGITTSYVNFRRQNEIVSGDTKIYRDNASLFRFLGRLSLEWQCIFRIGFDVRTKQPVALFCNYDEDKSIEAFCNAIGGSVGSSVLWEYKGGKRNVMSYNCQYNTAAGGVGDNVQMTMINGQPTFRRFTAKGEKITTYRLNTAKMTKEMKDQANGAAQLQLFKKWEKAETWEEIEKYFTPIEETTAPQGVGLTSNIEAIGDPLCTSPARAKFGQGFPDVMKSKGIVFYHTGVTHKIDSSGYKISVSVADAFTVTGGSLVA